MRRNQTLLLAFSLLLITVLGCATTASRDKMLKSTLGFIPPQQPKTESALVYVVRPSGGGGLVRFNIFVNDPDKAEMEAGYTKGGQYIYFFLAPGTYTLYSVAENTAHGTLVAEANTTYYIEQMPKFGFLFARNQLRQLDDVEGKYLLHKCDGKTGEIKRTTFP